MNSKERVLATLEFRNPDRIPKDLWVLPAAKNRYGKDLEELVEKSNLDIASITGPFDHGFTPEYYEIGQYKDPWGSVWTNLQAGIIGEVKDPVFADYDNMAGYQAPVQQFLKEWEENKDVIAQKIEEVRKKKNL